LELAWNVLADLDLSPRGFMFWSIMQEGVNGIYLARELDRIMHERT
jgi:hypothetical protein